MNSATPFLSILLGGIPLLLVYLVGIILALVWWSRWPQVCAIVLAGCLVLLLTGIVHPLLQAQMIANRGSGSAASIGQSLAMISMIATVFRAVGFGLLIWAAFAGRPVPLAQLSAFETHPPR
jgi:hypothetical protein